MVSGLINWKARNSEFLSGTRNVFPRMVISTSFSYGRKISSIRGVLASAIGVPAPAIEAKARGDGGQWKQGPEVFNAPMGNVIRNERHGAWWIGRARDSVRFVKSLGAGWMTRSSVLRRSVEARTNSAI